MTGDTAWWDMLDRKQRVAVHDAWCRWSRRFLLDAALTNPLLSPWRSSIQEAVGFIPDPDPADALTSLDREYEKCLRAGEALPLGDRPTPFESGRAWWLRRPRAQREHLLAVATDRPMAPQAFATDASGFAALEQLRKAGDGEDRERALDSVRVLLAAFWFGDALEAEPCLPMFADFGEGWFTLFEDNNRRSALRVALARLDPEDIAGVPR